MKEALHLYDMNRQPDGIGLFVDCPNDRLPYPPSGVGAESVTFGIIIPRNRLEQPDVSLLYEVEKTQAPPAISLGNTQD